MKPFITSALALSLSACAATTPNLQNVPLAYRSQVTGLLSGRIDPWVVNPGEWGRGDEAAAGIFWSPLNPDADDAWLALASEISRRRTAERSPDPELWQGGLRMCTSHRVMTLVVHLSPSNWATSPTSRPQFTPARDRIRKQFETMRAAETAIRVTGSPAARAEARLARRALYQSPPYAGPDETGEANYKASLLQAEDCRVQSANIAWIDQQLLKRTMVTGGDMSARAVTATFALLHQFASRSSILIRWLPVFEPYALNGIIDANDYARSVDTILISTKKPQRYGSYQSCRDEVDRRTVHSEGLEVARDTIVANRATLKLPLLETVEATTRDLCARTYPFSM